MDWTGDEGPAELDAGEVYVRLTGGELAVTGECGRLQGGENGGKFVRASGEFDIGDLDVTLGVGWATD